MKTLNGQHRNDAGKIFKSVKILEWQAIIPMNCGYNNTILLSFMTLQVIRNFAKFTGKHLRQSLTFQKKQAQGLQLYLKKDFGTGAFL